MKKLVLSVIALLALLAVVRAFPQSPTPPVHGVELHPGLVEIGDGASDLGISFGLVSRADGQKGAWNVLPLRMTLRSGGRSLSVSLNGLSFLLRGGVRVGRPLLVASPVRGDVISVGGKVTVDAAVDGEVWVFGADAVLTPKADVSGSVVVLGGEAVRSPRARVAGTVTALPELRIPLLSGLASQASVPLLELGREALLFVLLAFLLFLLTYYMAGRQQALVQSIPSAWRPTLLTVLVSLVAVPILALLLVVSVFGIFLLPLLALLLAAAALDGFLAVATRIGAAVRAGTGTSSLFLFTSGLLGLFLFKLPAWAGILLALTRWEAAGKIGAVCRLVSLGATAAAVLYGFGAALAAARRKASA
jgi:hypothetical protein